MSGQVKGMTLLPQPAGTEFLDDEGQSRDAKTNKMVVHRIESFVISWAHQVLINIEVVDWNFNCRNPRSAIC